MANDTPDNLVDSWIDFGIKEKTMANVGTLNVTVKFNTKDLSVPLRLIAIPARIYLWTVNLFRKMSGKKMTTLNIKIEETEA